VEIVPDTKDWTWVLERPCPECGVDTRHIEPGHVAALLRANSGAWVDVVSQAPDAARRRVPQVWSPLEYACHVRDVFRLYDTRLRLMLDQDDPLFANWDQDRTAVEQRYSEQDPTIVANEIEEAAAQLAQHLDEVSGDQWKRPGRRSDGAAFTVESFVRYFIHDPLHHLYDVTGRRE